MFEANGCLTFQIRKWIWNSRICTVRILVLVSNLPPIGCVSPNTSGSCSRSSLNWVISWILVHRNLLRFCDFTNNFQHEIGESSIWNHLRGLQSNQTQGKESGKSNTGLRGEHVLWALISEWEGKWLLSVKCIEECLVCKCYVSVYYFFIHLRMSTCLCDSLLSGIWESGFRSYMQTKLLVFWYYLLKFMVFFYRTIIIRHQSDFF